MLEKDLQKQVAKFLDWKGLLWNHCANEMTIPAKNRVVYLSHMKSLGVKAGVPDIMVYNSNKTFKGLAIELKADVKGKLSDNQIKWLEDLHEVGFYACCCKSFESVQHVVEKYIANDTINIDTEKYKKTLQVF